MISDHETSCWHLLHDPQPGAPAPPPLQHLPRQRQNRSDHSDQGPSGAGPPPASQVFKLICRRNHGEVPCFLKTTVEIHTNTAPQGKWHCERRPCLIAFVRKQKVLPPQSRVGMRCPEQTVERTARYSQPGWQPPQECSLGLALPPASTRFVSALVRSVIVPSKRT